MLRGNTYQLHSWTAALWPNLDLPPCYRSTWAQPHHTLSVSHPSLQMLLRSWMTPMKNAQVCNGTVTCKLKETTYLCHFYPPACILSPILVAWEQQRRQCTTAQNNCTYTFYKKTTLHENNKHRKSIKVWCQAKQFPSNGSGNRLQSRTFYQKLTEFSTNSDSQNINHSQAGVLLQALRIATDSQGQGHTLHIKRTVGWISFQLLPQLLNKPLLQHKPTPNISTAIRT